MAAVISGIGSRRNDAGAPRAAASRAQARRDGRPRHRPLLVLIAISRPTSRRTIRSRRAGARCAGRRASLISSAPTRSGAMSSRASSGARAPSLLAGVVSVSISLALGVPSHAGGIRRAAGSRHPPRITDAIARLPVPDPRHRARRVPRAEPSQRDDRHRISATPRSSSVSRAPRCSR